MFPGDTRIDDLFKYQRYKTGDKEVGEIKKIVRFEKRFNHMEAGFADKKPTENPFRLNNVLLYSIVVVKISSN